MHNWEQVFIIVIAVLATLFVGTLVVFACHWRKSTDQAPPLFALAHNVAVQNQAYNVDYSVGSEQSRGSNVVDGDLYDDMAAPSGT